MINFIIVNDSKYIPSSNDWINSNDFFPSHIVNEKGEAVPPNFSGRCYKLIGKQDRKLSPFERLKNVVQAICLFIFSFFKQIDSQKWKDPFTQTHESRYFGKINPPSIQMQQVGTTNDISLIVPQDIFKRSLLSFLEDEDIAKCSEVNRVWNDFASKSDQALKDVPSIAFGKRKWTEYFGKNIGKQPPLPSDIQTILDAECPFYPPKKIRDTHILTLIPATFNKNKITIELIQNFSKAPKKGKPSDFDKILSSSYAEVPEKITDQPYWILMLKEPILPETFTISQLPAQYEFPHVVDAAVAFLTNYIPSKVRINKLKYWMSNSMIRPVYLQDTATGNIVEIPKLITLKQNDPLNYEYYWGITPIRKLDAHSIPESIPPQESNQ